MSDRPNKSFLRWKSNIPPEWLTWATFPLYLPEKKIALARKSNTKQPLSAVCSCFVCLSLDMTQQTAAKLS